VVGAMVKNNVFYSLGSPRLAMVGMAALAIGAVLSYGNPDTVSIWVLILPLLFLAVNLLMAILTNPRIYKRHGLLLFHVGLLSIVILSAIGRLTHFEADVEMVRDTVFDSTEVLRAKAGIWHDGTLAEVQFQQGHYTVDYSPGLVRGKTKSYITVFDPSGVATQKIVGDDTPLVLEGYRFYTSFNKGFAPILTWQPADGGEPLTGAIPMPSYPLFEYKQDNQWAPPDSEQIDFWLRLDTGLTEDEAWTLDGRHAQGILVVKSGDQRVELRPGESTKLPGGVLVYEQLTTWLGYKIFYDPTLFWLFIASVLTVVGMTAHFWRKITLDIQDQVHYKQKKMRIQSAVPGSRERA